MKSVLLALLLVSPTFVLVPTAQAACEPGTDPNSCAGTVTGPAKKLVHQVPGAIDIVIDFVTNIPPERCDWTDHGIVCYW